MTAIREYGAVKNKRVVLNLPASFDQMEVEVIVPIGEEIPNRVSGQAAKRSPGALKDKEGFVLRDDFEISASPRL